MNKFVKVMFGTTSGAKSDFEYKLNEINIANVWNPNTYNPKEMGGFNFSTIDNIEDAIEEFENYVTNENFEYSKLSSDEREIYDLLKSIEAE